MPSVFGPDFADRLPPRVLPLWITAEVGKGVTIEAACSDCVELARRAGMMVALVFHGIKLDVSGYDEPGAVAEEYHRRDV